MLLGWWLSLQSSRNRGIERLRILGDLASYNCDVQTTLFAAIFRDACVCGGQVQPEEVEKRLETFKTCNCQGKSEILVWDGLMSNK